LKLNVFGDTGYVDSVESRNVALNFEYSAVTSANSASFSSAPIENRLVGSASFQPSTNPILLPITPLGQSYTAYQVRTLTSPDLSIPEANIREDSVVNFKILRVPTSQSPLSYAGNLGLISIYWEISNI
jgi:hypothetical protein